MPPLLLTWALNAVALVIVAMFIPGVHLEGFGAALLAVALLGLINALIRPLFVLLTLPVTLLTLGLFHFVINALLFWWVGDLLSGFHVDGFMAALLGSLVYSFACGLLSRLIHKQYPAPKA